MKMWKSLIGLIVFVITFSMVGLPAMAQSQSSKYNGKVFVYDPKTLMWSAYDNGEVVKSGRGSGGSNFCHDTGHACHTPVGIFKVLSKGGADCHSSKYPLGKGGAPMQYCMFFSHFYAIHGSNEVRDYNASHGCIRIHPVDALWLSKNFINLGTMVVVKPY